MIGRRLLGHLKGRKVRNLTNGRMYTSKKQSASSTLRSQKALERLDCSLMMKCTRANSSPKAIAKRVISFKKFLARHPDFMSERARRMYVTNPHLREVRREMMTKYRDLLGLASTDPEVAKMLSFKLKNCRNGVEVVKYIECEREKTVGVANY